jgi:shikimate dehydrogenase
VGRGCPDTPRMVEIRGTTALVGLLGWPVSDSLSPQMQNAAFAALGLDWAYVALPTPPAGLAAAVRGLAAAGFRGANVTIPHKRAVFELCDDLDPVAHDSGSVNTLRFDKTRVVGASTDGAAVANQVQAAGRRCLILGAGGAAAAVAEALRRAGAGAVTLASRRDVDWPPAGDGYELIVNATPITGELVVVPRPEQQVVDLAYRPDGSDTALVEAARAAGCSTVVDGLDVLLAQGAASFEYWTGEPAPVAAMRAALSRQ